MIRTGHVYYTGSAGGVLDIFDSHAPDSCISSVNLRESGEVANDAPEFEVRWDGKKSERSRKCKNRDTNLRIIPFACTCTDCAVTTNQRTGLMQLSGAETEPLGKKDQSCAWPTPTNF
jgi:hypothetical protein